MDELKRVIDKSAQWLLDNQEPYAGGWGDQPGRGASTLNTAETIIALIEGDVPAGHKQIQQGVQFLLKHQCLNGTDRGSWPRELSSDGKTYMVPDMVRTSFAIEALSNAGMGIDGQPIKDAVDWLLDIRNNDGGWGYRRGSASAVMPTCFALMALLEACSAGMK